MLVFTCDLCIIASYVIYVFVILVLIMSRKQALEAIHKKIEEAKDREDRLQIMGYIQAVFDFGLLDQFEAQDLIFKAMGIRL